MKKLSRVPASRRKFTAFHLHRRKAFRIYTTSSCHGKPREYSLQLQNNPNARNPTYAEVVEFLVRDKTDEIPYTENFKCPSFAVTVFNNARKAGLRCGLVWVQFVGEYYGHALNAWYTEKGVIFTDSCGDSQDFCDNDKIVKVEIGKKYKPESLTRKDLEFSEYGTVKAVDIIW